MADSDLALLFGPKGPLAARIADFRHRDSQIEMAEKIEATINRAGVLVAEAGTGTGKTFAYLVPALRSGGKVIISTGTKTLQDQLFHRDIPTVIKALGIPVTTALLKGRANYVCLHHLEIAAADGRFTSRDDVKHIQSIKRFANRSLDGGGTGDRAELPEVPERAGAWNQAVSTRENCLGSQCSRYEECFVMKARKKAMESEVVVVNHHLFFADLVLKDDGAQDLLPACNTVIFDEAHQLPSTATMFFGESVSTSQLIELARDTRLMGIQHAADFKDLQDAAGALDIAARDLRLVVSEDFAKLPGQAVVSREGFDEVYADAQQKLTELRELLESQADRAQELANCMTRADEFAQRMTSWQDKSIEGYVRWSEAFSQSLAFHLTPLSIADIFRAQVFGQKRAWVFTSATLAVKGDFGHYQTEMGLTAPAAADDFEDDAFDERRVETSSWASPFDYPNQALLYLPENLPAPNTPTHTEAIVDAALPLIEAAGGRTFMLFTSLKAMDRAYEMLKTKFAEREYEFPLMVQGEGTRTELLERFRKLGNAVLVASHSFWEGVDVKGSALSVVVIDKLPFAAPDDPVLAARIAAIDAGGGNAFMQYQVPHAAITLKQGAGRLIRDETDRGVLMIGDTRLVDKPYGKRIWQSLPPMRRTRLETEAVAFFDVTTTTGSPT
ncbi:MAG: ATP-dependent DNA helicase [Burkholderiales bacterium]|jgi:ATP-dependent DNA helicase DinG|nr:ATP-dependent DNA helicase [Betaproteobacteria bacterium]